MKVVYLQFLSNRLTLLILEMFRDPGFPMSNNDEGVFSQDQSYFSLKCKNLKDNQSASQGRWIGNAE